MLKRLEYRGYDSAGVAVMDGSIRIFKGKGRVDEVRKTADLKLKTLNGIGHTRWATHGEPSQPNAHPHTDCTGKIAIAHNGIIENHKQLKKALEKRGHKFKSETDSEVIAHLIEEGKGDFEQRFISSLSKLDGSYAVLAINKDEPGKILLAKKDSPILIGVGKNENFIASDMPAVLPETKKRILLEDGEYAIVTQNKVVIKEIKDPETEVNRKPETVTWNMEQAEKGGYEHFMLKEIFEQPQSIRDALKARQETEGVIRKIGKKRLVFVGCGTAYHSTLVAKYILQEFGINAQCEMASEFRYSSVKGLDQNSIVVAVSQSGETADTIAAVREAGRRSIPVVSVVNVVGSTLSRVSDYVIYSRSGPEVAVASTKAYIGQVTVLTMLSLLMAGKQSLLRELNKVPEEIEKILDGAEKIKKLAKKLEKTEDYFYIARGINLPTAMEGSLKLKEISYLHAEAYAAGELKHGPLALMENKVCVVAINPHNRLYEKTSSNIQEARTRKARILELTDGRSFMVKDSTITTPSVNPVFAPLTMIIPLQLLSYYAAVSKGYDPDYPRNLAKSVTVE